MLRDHAGTSESRGGRGWGLEPATREGVKAAGAASSAYTTVPLDLEPKPLIVAEEMNTTTRAGALPQPGEGGKNTTAILTLAKKLVNEGSHMLDLCCAIVGEDEKGVHEQRSWRRSPRACRRRSWWTRPRPTWWRRR